MLSAELNYNNTTDVRMDMHVQLQKLMHDEHRLQPIHADDPGAG